MGQALRALASEVERNGPLGLAPAGHLLEWPHVRLHPLTFDRLELVSVRPEKERGDDAVGRQGRGVVGRPGARRDGGATGPVSQTHRYPPSRPSSRRPSTSITARQRTTR